MMFKRKTKKIENPPINSFIEFCKTKSQSPLGVRIMIATEVCYALQIPLDRFDVIKSNVETKKVFEKNKELK